MLVYYTYVPLRSCAVSIAERRNFTITYTYRARIPGDNPLYNVGNLDEGALVFASANPTGAYLSRCCHFLIKVLRRGLYSGGVKGRGTFGTIAQESKRPLLTLLCQNVPKMGGLKRRVYVAFSCVPAVASAAVASAL